MFLGEVSMQLAPQSLQIPASKKWNWMVPVATLTASVAAFIASLSFAVFSIKTWTAKRDADLVKIGVSVLRVDPEKETQISEATREWALDLIDANAGGVKFSPEARAQLLKVPLKSTGPYSGGYDPGFAAGSFDTKPGKPNPPRPSPEPPK
jgi:hypothetical protein